jgi:nitrile hydratase beta subunit
MNGVHDMGGMEGMGALHVEKNEPVFHAAWEGRAFAIAREVQASGKLRVGLRPAIESIPAPEYLRMSYYEIWLTMIIERMVASGLVTREEIETGKATPGSPRSTPPLTAAEVPAWIAKGAPTRRDAKVAPFFKVGERVRARNLNPSMHTRLPRYARAKSGTIERDYGVFAFPDTNVYRLGEKLQHVYSVRFFARELWGNRAAPQDTVYIDMWDDYLEPA